MLISFLVTREWRNWQTRTVQVRVPVRAWGFKSPLAHQEKAPEASGAFFRARIDCVVIADNADSSFLFALE